MFIGMLIVCSRLLVSLFCLALKVVCDDDGGTGLLGTASLPTVG